VKDNTISSMTQRGME